MTKDDDPKTTDKYPIEPPDPDLAKDAVDAYGGPVWLKDY